VCRPSWNRACGTPAAARIDRQAVRHEAIARVGSICLLRATPESASGSLLVQAGLGSFPRSLDAQCARHRWWPFERWLDRALLRSGSYPGTRHTNLGAAGKPQFLAANRATFRHASLPLEFRS
jgi:hypothetical protein